MNIIDKSKNFVPNANPLLYATDSYKISHILFETSGVKEIYSNATPRFDKYMQELLGKNYDRQYVLFGLQWTLLRMYHMFNKSFFDKPKKDVINEMKEVLGPYIGQEKFDHFEELHDLGYLPIEVKALPEGTVAPIGVPFLTIRNTLPEFEWLPNYLETYISMEIWKPTTVATIARVYRKISNKFALETTGSIAGTEWQNHDFHSRGSSGFESCGINGAAFLTSSHGTDNLSALWVAKNFYQGVTAGSVPAGEHSVTTSGIITEMERAKAAPKPDIICRGEAEFIYIEGLLQNKFPKGIVSYVADSFDYWECVTNILPQLKTTIMARDGKFVIRGDSGNPVHIIAGYRIKDVSDVESSKLMEIAYKEYSTLNGAEVLKHGENYFKIIPSDFGQLIQIKRHEAIGTIACLWETFGGIINPLGYKELDSHIGMIYGDGITVQRAKEILTRLKEKKFASTNIVFGVGSYSLNMLSRDHLGMAIKATNTLVDINGKIVDMPIYKDPKTDASKKSARGLLKVFEENGKITFSDNVTRKEEKRGMLQTAFIDGDFYIDESLETIRKRIWS